MSDTPDGSGNAGTPGLTTDPDQQATPDGSDAQGGGQPGTQDGGLPKAWMSQLSDELKQNAVLSGFENTEAVARAYLGQLESQKQMLQMPTEKSTVEEKREYLTKLGVPEEAAKYSFEEPSLPEGLTFDENFLNRFKQAAFLAEMPQGAATKIFNWYHGELVDQHNRRAAAQEAAATEAMTVLKTEWGANWDKNQEVFRRGVRAIGGDQLFDWMQAKKLDNDPVFLKIFYNVGLKMTEATVPGEPVPPGEGQGTGRRTLKYDKPMPKPMQT